MWRRGGVSDDETLPLCDFMELLDGRLAAIPAMAADEGRWEAEYMSGMGMAGIRRKAVALILISKGERERFYDIWIDDPASVGPYPHQHNDAEDNLSRYLREGGWRGYDTRLSAYFLEDVEGRRYLFAECESSDNFKFAVEHSRTHWLQLAEAYGLSGFIGRFVVNVSRANGYSFDNRFEVFLDSDAFERQRENEYLRSLAARYGMTYFQFMRLRLLSRGSAAASLRQRDEDTAREIASQPSDD